MDLQHQPHFPGFKEQFIPEIGMGNGNQSLGTLRERSAAQLGNAIFRNDHIHFVPARSHTGTGRQEGFDLADSSSLGRGWERNKAKGIK